MAHGRREHGRRYGSEVHDGRTRRGGETPTHMRGLWVLLHEMGDLLRSFPPASTSKRAPALVCAYMNVLAAATQ